MSLRRFKASTFMFTVATLACSGNPGSVFGQDSFRTDLSRHTVPLEEIVSGGPGKDGIPAIDQPKFVDRSQANRWLSDREPVAVVQLGGEIRVYPLQILIWHEIVNDEIGGLPVTVTFCPLCNTTIAFDGRFDGKILDFGVTGRLRHSDMVMYDRQTETWWQQATGEGIVGEYAGEQLTFIPSPVMSWKDVKDNLEDFKVLSRDTGHRRRYGDNPYAGYDDGRGPMARFFSFGRKDDRLRAMERVVTLGDGTEALAVPFAELNAVRVANVEVKGQRLAVFWAPGTATALGTRSIAQGRDVGSSAVFSSVVDGRTLTFEEAGDGRYRDRETGSEWNLLGLAVGGELAGTQLEAVPHANHFWFAWAVFRPDTEIWRR